MLLDANVLLLHTVGSLRRELVGQFYGLKEYQATDFDLLQSYLRKCPSLVTTPNVWTEVSNLLGRARIVPPLTMALSESLRTGIGKFEETFHSSREAAEDRAFVRLGLTDASLLLALDRKTILLTTDAPLYREVIGRKLQAVNFHHLREDGGLV